MKQLCRCCSTDPLPVDAAYDGPPYCHPCQREHNRIYGEYLNARPTGQVKA